MERKQQHRHGKEGNFWEVEGKNVSDKGGTAGGERKSKESSSNGAFDIS